jgi:predicted nucleic acid-binding protein
LTFYLDTSVLVALLTPEAHSGRADAWVVQHGEEKLLISGWVEAEYAAAIAAKLRAGVLTPEARERVVSAFTDLAASTFESAPPSHGTFDTAARFAGYPDAKLKAGDALHLAYAHGHSATLCTLDRRQADAGAVLSVPTLLL